MLYASVGAAVLEGLEQNQSAEKMDAGARRAAVRGTLKTVKELFVCVVQSCTGAALGEKSEVKARLEELCTGIEDVVVAAGAVSNFPFAFLLGN